MEINQLELELEDRVRLVLDSHNVVGDDDFSEGYTFQPHRESMMVERGRMLAEFGADASTLYMEPWLDSFIKCECLKTMCDEVASKFADMLAVNSVQLGSVLRKLRLTYRQSFEQMHVSWKDLRQSYLDTSGNLHDSSNVIAKLRHDLESKEVEMNKHFDNEVLRLNAEFNAEKSRDQEKITQTEFKMEQMSDTLKYLNGIFRTMQSDGATVKTVDLQAKCYRLEKDNELLQTQNSSLDAVKATLAKAEQRVRTLEKENRHQEAELHRMNVQLERREEAVKVLMEKEALRNAEIEKLQKISKLKDDELVAVDLKDSSTSVLCIKCKKSLDDLSNIRSAILGDPNASKTIKMQCEAFRILLPNLKGRQPNRQTKWLRACMRGMLVSKLKEDVHLHFIKGHSSRFPAFAYSWFVRKTDGRVGSHLTKLLMAADEDRWGLYYGVRSLSKEDPESLVFWSLLDETYGEDGMHFIMYCLSVLLSIGGPLLWKQFGTAMENGANINVKPEDKVVLDTIWIDIVTAKEAVRLILVRALASHIADAVDAIDALKVRPSDVDIDAMQQLMREEKRSRHASASVSVASGRSSTGGPFGSAVAPDLAEDAEGAEDRPGSVRNPAPESEPAPVPETEVPPQEKDPAFEATVAHSALLSSTEPTHINVFMWLRLMMQQLHADQIQRAAAVRLMFETASVGALTPQTAYAAGGGGESNGAFAASGTHVEYPQFQSICQTLFPHVPVTETAALYANCFEAGQRRVHSEVFVKCADRMGLFAHALKLPLLPLLRQSSHQQAPHRVTAAIPVTHVVLGEKEVKEDEEGPQTEVEETREESPKINSMHSIFSLHTEHAVRSKLATMVHRRLATVKPAIHILMQDLPERWCSVVQDALDAVQVALVDSQSKLRNRYADGAEEGAEEQPRARTYIDGIQPFIAYRRLLLLSSLIKTLCDNPLLPAELFSAAELDNKTSNIDQAMFRAEKLLNSIEQGFLLAPGGATTKRNVLMGILEKYSAFETVRVSLLARRLQTLFRRFLSRDLPVPRSVRLCMSPGYLGTASFASTPADKSAGMMARVTGEVNANGQSFLKGGVLMERLLLRNREVYHDPWWGQALVGEVYRFKITYDMKAAALGLPPLSLAQAVVASQCRLWGSQELAETMVHDLFVCARSYRFAVSRLRLFSAFLGDGRDLDEPVAELLATPQAVAVYLNLLAELHRELQKEEIDNQDQGEGGGRMAPIHILFPATENALTRHDKRDVWFCSVGVIQGVTERWAARQSSVGGAQVIFLDLPEKLRPNAMQQIEVDDYLWLMLTQWAKITAWSVMHTSKSATLIEREFLTSKTQQGKGGPRDKDPGGRIMTALRNGAFGKARTLEHKSRFETLPSLPLANLHSIVVDVYRQGEGSSRNRGSVTLDAQHYVNCYLRRVGIRRANLKKFHPVYKPESAAAPLPTAFSSEMTHLMRDCVLWDTNTLDDGYRSALDLLSREGTPSLPCSPELSLHMVQSVFASYQPAIKQLLDQCVEELEDSSDAEFEATFQAASALFLAMADKLDQRECTSFKIYKHEADSSSLRNITDHAARAQLDSTHQKMTPAALALSHAGLLQNAASTQDAWTHWQALASSVSALAIAMAVEPPHDPWAGGMKIHVDRAFVFSVYTKNTPDQS